MVGLRRSLLSFLMMRLLRPQGQGGYQIFYDPSYVGMRGSMMGVSLEMDGACCMLHVVRNVANGEPG